MTVQHLTDATIIEFVSLDALDPRANRLLAEVTTHIRACKPCRDRVRTFQNVYDTLVAEGMDARAALEKRAETPEPKPM